MKKIVKSAMALAMTLGVISSAHAEIPERVEIQFSIGEETLLINSEPVTVQKPYVVGNGVTLVPLRVITEAFGAEVEWIGESGEIKLSYPDVDITLTIGNTLAEVNGIAENLPVPPELKDGTTMVPLRFISETFGADVSYDSENMNITVIKESSDTSGTVVDEVITESRIGDSYYNWSMENPMGYDISYKSFDGKHVSFSSDTYSSIDISVNEKDEDYNFDRNFIEMKSSFAGYILKKAEKNTEGPVKSMNFRVGTSYGFMNVLIFETDKYIIEVNGSFDNENEEEKNEGIRLMETFVCNFTTEDTYDLSEVEDGMKEFKSDDWKISFKVPQGFEEALYGGAENELLFSSADTEDLISQISVKIFSKDDAESAEKMANTDYAKDKKYMNPDIVTLSDLVPVTYENFEGFEYSIQVKESISNNMCGKSVFFELGEYIYNVKISQKDAENFDEQINKVINSVKAEELDFEEIGTIMRIDGNYEGSFTSKNDEGWSVIVPNSFEVYEDMFFSSWLNQSSLSVWMTNSDEKTLSDIKKDMNDELKEARGYIDFEIKEAPHQIKLKGNQPYMAYTVFIEEEGSYTREIYTLIGNKTVNFNVSVHEIFWSDNTLSEIEDIITSYKNEK